MEREGKGGAFIVVSLSLWRRATGRLIRCKQACLLILPFEISMPFLRSEVANVLPVASLLSLKFRVELCPWIYAMR